MILYAVELKINGTLLSCDWIFGSREYMYRKSGKIELAITAKSREEAIEKSIQLLGIARAIKVGEVITLRKL